MLLASLIACADVRTTPLFREIGATALPGVVTLCGSPSKDWIIEVNGGGIALGDFDGDGVLDLVIVDGSTIERVDAFDRTASGDPVTHRAARGNPPRLFLGNGDCTFRPAPPSWNMDGGRWGMGVAAGDLDGDGDLDLVVTEWGRTRVFLNQDKKGFVEVTEKAGLFAGIEWSTSAALFDYDHDGKLDLAIVNYLAFDTKTIAKRGSGPCKWKGHDVMCGPEGLVPQAARLYHGKGDGSFEDVTATSGFATAPPAFGLGVLTIDYDGDGDTDLYVSNDSMPNYLWENQGDGTFREVGWKRGVGYDANGKEQASMGIAAGDVNGDGREDLFVTNFSGENNDLYLSTKNGGFRERSSAAGLAGPSYPLLGWGTQIVDFDLDGDLDIAVVDGHVYPEANEPGTDTSYAQPSYLFVNDGTGRFTAEPLAATGPMILRASAAGDLDNDGDIDIVAIGVEGPVRVFKNETKHGDSTHWLRVKLQARGGNRDGIGARVTARAGSRSWVSEIRTSGGFQAAVPAEAHFGLGAIPKLDALVVRWPSGREQTLSDVAVDRVIVVTEEVAK